MDLFSALTEMKLHNTSNALLFHVSASDMDGLVLYTLN